MYTTLFFVIVYKSWRMLQYLKQEQQDRKVYDRYGLLHHSNDILHFVPCLDIIGSYAMWLPVDKKLYHGLRLIPPFYPFRMSLL
jgi:hypothetical protein